RAGGPSADDQRIAVPRQYVGGVRDQRLPGPQCERLVAAEAPRGAAREQGAEPRHAPRLRERLCLTIGIKKYLSNPPGLSSGGKCRRAQRFAVRRRSIFMLSCVRITGPANLISTPD